VAASPSFLIVTLPPPKQQGIGHFYYKDWIITGSVLHQKFEKVRRRVNGLIG
jgi:hypothetical protein